MMIFRSNEKRQRGFTVLGVLIAIGILSAMGAGMAAMIATNQSTRTQQLYMDQAFYNSQAGLEFALGQILDSGSASTSFSRDFGGETITVTRTSNLIQVATAKGQAEANYSITDPNPPTAASCLDVDQSSKAVTTINVTGLVLSRNASCTDALTIETMTLTWQPDNSETIRRIRVDGVDLYNSVTGQASGTTVDITDKTISDYSNHPINFLRWNTTITNHDFILVFNMSDGSSKTVNVDFLADSQADCFVVSTSSATLTAVASVWRQLTGLTVQNTCSSAIRLDKMTVSWTPTTPARNLNIVRINATNIYNSTAATGTEIEVDHIINASTTHTVNYLQFSAEMLNRNYTILWEFSDGTTETTTLDLFASSQDTCLTLGTSSASIGGTGNRQIQGMTLTNGCTADIAMTSVAVSWSGDAAKRMQIVRVGGANKFNGSSASGVTSDFGNNDIYLVDGGGDITFDYLQFSTAVTPSATYTLLWTMSDSTTKSTTVTVDAQSNSLSVSTSSATIAGSGDVDLMGVTLSNTGSTTITIIRMVVSWTPVAPARRTQTVRIDGADVWTGSAVTGATLNITDVSLTASQTKNMDYMRYNGDMSGRTFTIQFQMIDGSSLTTSSFTPPDG